MDKNKKLSFQGEMEREAKKIEEELKAHPELNDSIVSDDLDDAICKQIQAYEKEQKKNTNETKEKSRKIPHNKKFLLTLVAVVTLMCAMGVTSIGSKSYKKQVEHGVYGMQKVQNVDVQDMEKYESTENGEIFAFQEVEKEIGILPVRLTHKPNNMEFLRYQIDQEEQRAKIFYQYKNNIIQYDIYKNESDSSLGKNQEDELVGSFEVEQEGQLIVIKEYRIPENNEEYYLMSFKYKEVNYQLKGKLDEKGLRKIVENLKFL